VYKASYSFLLLHTKRKIKGSLVKRNASTRPCVSILNNLKTAQSLSFLPLPFYKRLAARLLAITGQCFLYPFPVFLLQSNVHRQAKAVALSPTLEDKDLLEWGQRRHSNDPRAGTPLLGRKAGRAGAVQPAEVKAPARP